MNKKLLDKRVAQVLKVLAPGNIFIGMLRSDSLFWDPVSLIFRAVRITDANPRSNFLTLVDRNAVSLEMITATAKWHGTIDD